jgi:HSP20 family protein
MSLVKWDPFGTVSSLQGRINRLFDDAFSSRAGADDTLSMGSWSPAVDIYDRSDAIVIHAELPGVKKEDISIEVKQNVLTLKGERVATQEVREESYYRRERSFGCFQRSFTLPEMVNPDQIKAKFKDGVLEIEVPKPEEAKPKQINVKVE